MPNIDIRFLANAWDTTFSFNYDAPTPTVAIAYAPPVLTLLRASDYAMDDFRVEAPSFNLPPALAPNSFNLPPALAPNSFN